MFYKIVDGRSYLPNEILSPTNVLCNGNDIYIFFQYERAEYEPIGDYFIYRNYLGFSVRINGLWHTILADIPFDFGSHKTIIWAYNGKIYMIYPNYSDENWYKIRELSVRINPDTNMAEFSLDAIYEWSPYRSLGFDICGDIVALAYEPPPDGYSTAYWVFLEVVNLLTKNVESYLCNINEVMGLISSRANIEHPGFYNVSYEFYYVSSGVGLIGNSFYFMITATRYEFIDSYNANPVRVVFIVWYNYSSQSWSYKEIDLPPDIMQNGTRYTYDPFICGRVGNEIVVGMALMPELQSY